MDVELTPTGDIKKILENYDNFVSWSSKTNEIVYSGDLLPEEKLIKLLKLNHLTNQVEEETNYSRDYFYKLTANIKKLKDPKFNEKDLFTVSAKYIIAISFICGLSSAQTGQILNEFNLPFNLQRSCENIEYANLLDYNRGGRLNIEQANAILESKGINLLGSQGSVRKERAG